MENKDTLELQQQLENEQLANQELNLQPAKNNKLLIVFLSFLSLTSILLAIFFGYKYSQEKQELDISPIAPMVLLEEDSLSETLSNKKSWLFYENSSLGFKIQYPEQIKIEKEFDDQNNRATIFKGDDLHFEVMLRDKPDNFSLKDYFYMDFPIAEETFYKNYPANIYKMPNGYCDGPGCSEPYTSIVFESDSEIFHINFFGDSVLSEIEQDILDTFEFMSLELVNEKEEGVSIVSKRPEGWITHKFTDKNLVIHTPFQWKSSIEEFTESSSALIRFWEAGEEKNATIQFGIKPNWDNIGIGNNYTFFNVAGSIQAYRFDPPKMEDVKLDRYQSNFYFEREEKVYTLDCVHNWMEVNIETCEIMLETMEFTD